MTLLTGPTLSRVVDRLVSDSLVYREVDAADRRKIRVFLSRRGQSLHRRLAPRVHEVEHEVLDQLGGQRGLDRLSNLSV